MIKYCKSLGKGALNLKDFYNLTDDYYRVWLPMNNELFPILI